MIDGKKLIEWGFEPGPWFSKAIREANKHLSNGVPLAAVEEIVRSMRPEPVVTIPLDEVPSPYQVFLEPENELERENLAKVMADMDALMRVPTVVRGVVMPDACPAGVIPVGGVVATKDAIHPGFHSADVCCSMALTVFKDEQDLKHILNVVQAITHFGPGGRTRFLMPNSLVEDFKKNSFLKDLVQLGHRDLGTQGDGNHFLFVGTLRSTGKPAIVTHHGSRGVGAMLFKRGMAAAKKQTEVLSPQTPSAASWIDANSQEGRDYWEALQTVRRWTSWNHYVIHRAIEETIDNPCTDRFWNEHNFVFKRDRLFYHAKGATPSFDGYSADDCGRTLIPMNMSEPILITRHTDNPDALGFAPHGAGRNMSRTQHMKGLGQEFGDHRGISPRDKRIILERETQGLDIRSFSGTADLSELPSAYKSAEQVIRSINKHKLADVVDYIDPYGSIMAGEVSWQRNKR